MGANLPWRSGRNLMEKVMYHVWKSDAEERDTFRDRLLGELIHEESS